MAIDNAAPCRHPGAPPDAVVDRVSDVIATLASDAKYLASKGLSIQEYEHAFQAAIQKLRGRYAASTANRRSFLVGLFNNMKARGHISGFEMPRYGEDTVYRLEVPDLGSVAIIQKGCPDGKHSSVKWSRPGWAAETYLWWLCPSMNYEPGEHVWKGVNRLRQRFFSDVPDVLDGVIFHNELCGSSSRPCPKANQSLVIDGQSVPPPCLYVMPKREDGANSWNWDGEREVSFPRVLNAMFNISNTQSPAFTSYVGFQQHGADVRTIISCHFGPGRSISHRS